MRLQEGAFLEGVVALQEFVDEGARVFLAGGGEEAQVAEIDAEDGWEGGRRAAVHELHRGEQCAVAADGEEEVAAVDAVAVGHLPCGYAAAVQRLGEGGQVGFGLVVDVAYVECYFHGLGAILLLSPCR